MDLSGKQKRYLRSLAHHLEPVVRLGKAGIVDGVVRAVERALEDHELIKVRVMNEAPVDRHEAGNQLSAHTNAALVQVLGRNVLLYRPRAEDPTIVLPAARAKS